MAAAAFSRQSVIFDNLYAPNTIVTYKRERVRAHVNRYILPGSRVLELNAGTGEDATWFARSGHTVHATDVSDGMQQVLTKKVRAARLPHRITNEICSFTQLHQLQNKGPYDYIFSNFAGLNCTGELDKVIQSLEPLLKPGGVATLVILPSFCLWETLLLIRGKFKTAFRRWFSKQGVQAHLEGVYFPCWYYNPAYVRKAAKNKFEVLSVEGLCTVVPPSYLEGFAEKHPRLYRLFRKWEMQVRFSRPWRSIGDYYIISLRKPA